MRKNRSFTFLFILIIAIPIICSGNMYAQKAQVGKKAPPFILKDLQGKTFSLDKLIGKGVIHLTFLATWCDPCRRDYRKLNDDYAMFRSRGYIILGIGVPTRQNQEKLKGFAARENLRFPVLFDSSGEVVRAYNASLPRNIIIDRNGMIIHQWDFLPSNHEEIIEGLLSGKQ